MACSQDLHLRLLQGFCFSILTWSHLMYRPHDEPIHLLRRVDRSDQCPDQENTSITHQPAVPPAKCPSPGLQKPPSQAEGRLKSLSHRHWPSATPHLTLPSSHNPPSWRGPPGELGTADSVAWGGVWPGNLHFSRNTVFWTWITGGLMRPHLKKWSHEERKNRI